MENQALALLREQVSGVILGTLFLFIGVAACGIAAMRRRSGVRVLVWLGIWSAMYGVRPLVDSLAGMGLLSHRLQACVPYLDVAMMYLILPAATLAWVELSCGKLRSLLQAVAVLGLAIGLAGIGIFLYSGASGTLVPYNNLLAATLLAFLVTILAVPRLGASSW